MVTSHATILMIFLSQQRWFVVYMLLSMNASNMNELDVTKPLASVKDCHK